MLQSIKMLMAAGALAVWGTPLAKAQDCPRGELDKAYCDRNGDMVADAPADQGSERYPAAIGSRAAHDFARAASAAATPIVADQVNEGFVRAIAVEIAEYKHISERLAAFQSSKDRPDGGLLPQLRRADREVGWMDWPTWVNPPFL
jgi:hypothetical protein